MLSRLWILSLTLLSHYRHHRSQAIFLLLGLSLGVAMLLATLIISSAAKTAFSEAQQTLAGQAVAHLLPRNGQRTLPEQLYRDLRLLGITDSLPMVEGRLMTATGALQIRGTDLFPLLNKNSDHTARQSERLEQLQRDLRVSTDDVNPLMAFSYPPWLTVTSESYARIQGLNADSDSLQLPDGTPLPELRILKDSAGLGYFLLCDIRCAQRYLNMEQQLTSIVFTALTETQQALIAERFGNRAELVMADKNLKNPAFTNAFLLNLQAIGFLAFLVGCFIAFNAVRFAVLQRSHTVQQMRLSGATAGEISIALLLELLLWALLASITGLLLAWKLSQLLLPGIGMTLEQLFFSDNLLVSQTLQSWWLQSAGLSLLATLIATLIPLLQLSRQAPLESSPAPLELPSATQFALPLLLAGGLFAFVPELQPDSHWAGLLITTALFIGGALLVPGALSLCYRQLTGIRYLLRFPALHWLLSEGHRDHQRQTLAMAALTIALAACVAILTMVSSFRMAFIDYLDTTLPESIYLNIDPSQQADVLPFLDQHRDVALSYPFLMDNATINGKAGIVRGLTDDSLRQTSLSLESYSADSQKALWQALHQRQGVLVNQALALNYGISAGETLQVKINGAELTVDVLGTYFSYGSLVNAFVMDQQWLTELWPDLHTRRIGVFVKQGADSSAVLAQLKQQFQLQSHHYTLPGAVKQRALNVFQQTFQATQLLSLVILIIAAFGIFCACYIAQLDKLRQLALVHVLGLSYQRIISLSLLQLFINAGIASLVALPLGLLIAWACVHLVLKLAFGWYFNLNIDTARLLLLVSGSLLTVVAGALIPLLISSRRLDARSLIR
ncbi:MAG: ABC transporter permease [Amphritea sp.]|nr:ABC transporter permease [Amphritea sp.]